MDDILISMLSDALHEKITKQIPKTEELNLLMNEAQRHGVAAVFNRALPEESATCVQQLEAKLHAVDMAQEYEGAVILQKMAERRIPCIPLKGWVLREMYPKPYMRTRGDLDLLVHPEQLPETEQLMAELGYIKENENFTDYHICYNKPPYLTLEIHVRLTEEDKCTVFESVWERAVPRKDGCFQLCEEDNYLFMVYHGAKHALLGGIGLRYIMDLWVLLNYFANVSGDIMREHVSQGLNMLGLTSFAAYSEQLATEWFGLTGISLTKITPDLETMRLWRKFILSSGTFGGAVSSYENQLTRSSAPVLVAAKIFPCRAQMEIRYPELRQKPWLLPKFWIIRLWQKLRGGEALTGARAFTSVSREERKQREYLLTNLGLF